MIKNNNDDEFNISKIDYLESISSRLNDIEHLILNIEKQKTLREKESIIRNLMSIVHSVKGSAAAYEFTTIASICHTLEDITINIQNHVTVLSENVINELLNYNDLIRKYCTEYLKNGTVNENDYIIGNPTLPKNHSSSTDTNHLFSVRILCVGNIKTFIKGFAERINGVKIEARYVEDGLDALNLVAKEHFDFLITSNQISTINGLPLISVVKQMSLGGELVTILLTSESNQINTTNSNTDPDYIILKDLNFLDKLQEIFKSRVQANITFLVKKPAGSNEIKRIVYIDDDEEVIKLVQILFRKNPQYEVKYIIDSKKAESEIKSFLPDIILSDLNMPNLDGISLIKKLRQNEELQKIPVVIVTGENTEAIKNELISNGALNVLNKSKIMKELPVFLSKTRIN